jgi:hypothetical protein
MPQADKVPPHFKATKQTRNAKCREGLMTLVRLLYKSFGFILP